MRQDDLHGHDHENDQATLEKRFIELSVDLVPQKLDLENAVSNDFRNTAVTQFLSCACSCTFRSFLVVQHCTV